MTVSKDLHFFRFPGQIKYLWQQLNYLYIYNTHHGSRIRLPARLGNSQRLYVWKFTKQISYEKRISFGISVEFVRTCALKRSLPKNRVVTYHVNRSFTIISVFQSPFTDVRELIRLSCRKYFKNNFFSRVFSKTPSDANVKNHGIKTFFVRHSTRALHGPV